MVQFNFNDVIPRSSIPLLHHNCVVYIRISACLSSRLGAEEPKAYKITAESLLHSDGNSFTASISFFFNPRSFFFYPS